MWMCVMSSYKPDKSEMEKHAENNAVTSFGNNTVSSHTVDAACSPRPLDVDIYRSSRPSKSWRSRKRASSGYTGEVVRKKKRRRRRGRARRSYKPYMKMTWDEKRALESKEERRAEETRKERFQNGIPVAPYNTTQFLLQDRQARTEHQREDVDDILLQMQQHHHRQRRRSESNNTEGTGSAASDTGGEEGASSSVSDFEEYFEKEFSADYTSAHAERLETMSKADLIRDYIELEQRMEDVECKLAIQWKRNTDLQSENESLRSQVDKLLRPPSRNASSATLVSVETVGQLSLPPPSSAPDPHRPDRCTSPMAKCSIDSSGLSQHPAKTEGISPISTMDNTSVISCPTTTSDGSGYNPDDQACAGQKQLQMTCL